MNLIDRLMQGVGLTPPFVIFLDCGAFSIGDLLQHSEEVSELEILDIEPDNHYKVVPFGCEAHLQFLTKNKNFIYI